MSAHAHVSIDQVRGGTVADAMLRRPKTLPAGATVGDVRRLFAEHPTVRTALLVDGGALAGAVERGDLPEAASDGAPAADYAGGAATVSVETPLDEALAVLAGRAEQRLVVVDADGVTLQGLLCPSGGGNSFCVGP